MSKFSFMVLTIAVAAIVACNTKTDNPDIKSADSLSIEQITNLIHENPNNGELLVSRAKKHFENNQMNEAITDLNSAIQKENVQESYFTLLAEYYLYIGQSENTKDVLEKCIKKFPKSTDARQKLAQLHFYVKQYKKALEVLHEVQEIDENIAQTYFLRGLILEESGDTANAINQFLRSTEKNQNYYEAYIILGLRFTDKKDSIAIDYFRNALRIKPNSAEAHFNIAFFYQKTGKIKKAVEGYENLISKVDSLYKFAYYNLGYIHLEYFKEYPKAASFFQQAIDLDGSYFQAWYNLGLCLEKMKEFKKSATFYKQALILEPDFDIAMEALKRVEKK